MALGLLTRSPQGRLSFWPSPALPLRSPSRQNLESKGDLSLNFCTDEVERGICWPRNEIFSSLTHADNRNLLNEELSFEHPSIPSCLGCGCPQRLTRGQGRLLRLAPKARAPELGVGVHGCPPGTHRVLTALQQHKLLWKKFHEQA